MTTDRITAYGAARQAEGAANATINRELTALKRMFRLGEVAGWVAQRPHIPMLQAPHPDAPGFEAAEFRAVLARLPDAIKPLPEVAYITGWRIRSELLTRQWMHVDFEAGWLRLEPGETKNRKAGCSPCSRHSAPCSTASAPTRARSSARRTT